MSSDLEKINTFIKKHHVLTLATADGSELSACSLFYAYSKELKSFIVASSDDTTHIQHILKNNKIAGNILLETSLIGKIQGLQFQGKVEVLQENELSKLYFKSFPQALVMNPKLWQIKVSYFKMTDNTLGFGKKIIWQDSSL